MRNYTEEEMVKGCARNERFFQELLYRRFFASMMQLCLRYANDRSIAMEILNDGFLKVFKKIHTFQFKGSLEGWIRRIVFNTLSDYYKKHNKKLRFLDLEDRDEPIPERALSNLYFEDIMALVEQLPDATKRVFVLYAIEGWNHREIAQQLAISQGTSKWHLSAARKKLKALIEQQNKVQLYAS